MDTTSLWIHRRLIKATAEHEASDQIIDGAILEVTRHLRAELLEVGIDSEKWKKVPKMIVRATIYGTIATLWASHPEIFSSTGIIQEQFAMEYWEERFINSLQRFLQTKRVDIIKVEQLTSRIQVPLTN
ncbi:hypothetical protein KKH23_06560 [Patescibacteria group bacterium]|uniref:Uncharacterized protein n=1 Tax=viral metagenome TaxID=1070528 RepID=A0A6M3MF12_9ZZZZ|nr:hypothetical protein [Patescibacteria group bacterium]